MSQATASTTDEAVAAALRWLSEDDYIAKHNQILLERVPGVSEDLVSSAQFQQWLNGEQQALLFREVTWSLRHKRLLQQMSHLEKSHSKKYQLKTIFTSMVVDTLFENFSANLNIGIAFVYPIPMQCNRSLDKLLRIMLLQLGQRSPSVRPTLVDLHHCSNNNTSPLSTQDLLDTLENVISKMSKVYLVIDSLGDLTSDHRRGLLLGLHRLQDCLQVSLLVTSNSGEEVSSVEYDWLKSLGIPRNLAEYDLDSYIAGEIGSIARKGYVNSELIPEDLHTKITISAKGIFILVKALIDRLVAASKISPYSFQSQLYEVSSTDDAYSWLMHEIENQAKGNKYLAKMALSWTLFAQRPLKEVELRAAVGIKTESSEMEESGVPGTASIVASCGGLIKVTKTPVDQCSLIHPSAEKYLRQTIPGWNPHASTSVAESCLTYLAYDAFGEGHCKTDQDLESRMRDYPLYEYAAQQWPNHLRGIDILPERVVLSFLLDQNKVASANQAMGSSNTVFDGRQTGLHLAAQHGLNHVVALLLTERQDPAVEDSQGKTPLWLAAENSHAEVTRTLSRVDRKSFTLMLERKQYSLAHYLLEIAGQITRDSYFRTALHIGAMQKDVDLIQRALKFGVDINARDSDGYTAIQLAIQAQETSIIDALLQNSVSIEGITTSDWLKAYGRPPSDIVELSEHELGRQKQIGFVSADRLSTIGRFSSPYVRRVLILPDITAWPGDHNTNPLNILEGMILCSKSSPPADEHTVRYSILASIPRTSERTSSDLFSCRFQTIRVAWFLTFTPDASGIYQWRAFQYLSMLETGSVPNSGMELFKILIKIVLSAWLELCDSIDLHLLMCRPDILNANGDDPMIIRRLLGDANYWHFLRRLLREQVKAARTFRAEYIALVREDIAQGDFLASIVELEHEIGLRFDNFDAVSTALIQFEFTFTSVREAQRSTSINRSMKRLSWITFIYLPLIFVSGLFGMNVDLLESNPSWKWYAVLMVCTLSLTMIIWVIFKRFPDLEDGLEEKMSWLVGPSKFKEKRRDTEKGLLSSDKEKTT